MITIPSRKAIPRESDTFWLWFLVIPVYIKWYISVWLIFRSWLTLLVRTDIPTDHRYGMYRTIPMYQHMVLCDVLINRYVPLIPILCRTDTYCPYRGVCHDMVNLDLDPQLMVLSLHLYKAYMSIKYFVKIPSKSKLWSWTYKLLRHI